MKSKKPAEDQPADNEEQEIEKRVKRMLDPAEPDPEPEKPPFEIIPDTDEPSTAPEVKDDAPIKLPKSITIKSHDEEVAAAEETAEDTDKAEKVEESKKTPEPEDDTEQILETAEPTAPPVESKAIIVNDESEEATAITAKIGKLAAEEQTETVPPSEAVEQSDTPESDTGTEESPLDEDEKTDEAVGDIIAQEGDELLAAEDEKIAEAFDDKKPTRGQRLKNFFGAWWHNKIARRTTVLVVVVGIAAAMTVPVSRYFVLNTVGVRSSASVTVLDESTNQPLKNVQVSLRGQTALTDNDGVARLNGLKLGSGELTVEKRAFAEVTRNVTVGWGSNPLGDFKLTPVGSQYAFTVRDFLSDKPLAKIEAVSGEASAFSDEEGKIKLTIDKTDDEPFEVTLIGTDLREEKLTIDADDKDDHEVRMVPARKHVFISKRSGKYDVYKTDIDGKNEERILPGTGNERDDMVLVSHPTSEVVALVSTRENARNRNGFLLSTLTIIDLASNEAVKVAQSERLQIIDWIGDRLVFVRVAAGSSASNPKRHRLMSYDYQTGDSKEIASSNYFNDVTVARGAVYYAPSSAYQTAPVALYRVDADGANRRTVLGQETWSIFRTGYDKLTLATGRDWYDFFPADGSTNKLGGEPSDLRSRLYADSPDRKRSLWVDQRDGKGVLLAYNVESREDEEIHTQSGLKMPVRWLNNSTVVFRISTDQETADYAVSLNGGDPKKIRDVTNTAGIDDWYYY